MQSKTEQRAWVRQNRWVTHMTQARDVQSSSTQGVWARTCGRGRRWSGSGHWRLHRRGVHRTHKMGEVRGCRAARDSQGPEAPTIDTRAHGAGGVPVGQTLLWGSGQPQAPAGSPAPMMAPRVVTRVTRITPSSKRPPGLAHRRYSGSCLQPATRGRRNAGTTSGMHVKRLPKTNGWW